MRWFLAILLSWSIVQAQVKVLGPSIILPKTVIAPTVTPPSYLFHETFDGATLCYAAYTSNCDNALFYVQNGGGTVNFAYATSPAPLQGSNSMDLQTASNALIQEKGFTAQPTLYAAEIINVNANSANDDDLLVVTDTSFAAHCTADIYNGDSLVVRNSGGSNQSASHTFTAGTTYYIKVLAVAGSGANAQCTAYYSTNGSSWTATTTSTDGTWTSNTGGYTVAGQADITHKIIDDIRISTSDINYP